jgi:hypothetical protein
LGGTAGGAAAPRDQLAMVWRKDADGTPILIQVTDAVGLYRLNAKDQSALSMPRPVKDLRNARFG